MSTEENKAVVRRIVEESNKGLEACLAAMDELFAPDYVYHGPFGEMDLADWKQMGPAWYAAFPDTHLTLEDLIAEGDTVAWRYTFRGTHQGEFMGAPATGKVVTFTGILISRFAGGKDVEEWESMDMLGFLQQLGVIPQMAQAGA
jgi:predicted ester cyclase